MDINKIVQRELTKNKQINTFTKGMDTDTSDLYIDNERYRYAENLRITTSTDNNAGELHLVNGVDKIELYTKDADENASDYSGVVIGFESVRDLAVIVFAKESSGKFVSWSVCTFDVNTRKVSFIIDSCEEPIWDKEKWDGKSKPISTVLKYETNNNIKLYIADGIHNLLQIPLVDEDGNPKKLSNDFNELFSYDKLLLPPPEVALSLQPGGLKSAIVQYAYRLYKKHGASSTLSSFSKPISLYKTPSSGYESGAVTNCAVEVSLESFEDLYLDSVEIYRINFLMQGQAPVIDLVYDGKLISSYVDTGSSVKTVTVEDLLAMIRLNVHPSIIEQKNNYLFEGNVEYELQQIDYKFKDFDARVYSYGNYIPEDGGDSQFLKNYNGGNINDLKTIKPELLHHYQFDNAYVLPNYNPEYWKLFGVDTSTGSVTCTDNVKIYNNSENSTDYNGVGKTFAWKYTFSKHHGIDEYDKSTPRKTYRRGEIYRFGVRLFTKEGSVSSVKWMCDIMMPPFGMDGLGDFVPGYDINAFDGNHELSFASSDQGQDEHKYKVHELGIKFVPIITESNKSVWENVYGYEIVRCERSLTDSYIVAQGIIGYPMEVNPADSIITDENFKKQDATSIATLQAFAAGGYRMHSNSSDSGVSTTDENNSPVSGTFYRKYSSFATASKPKAYSRNNITHSGFLTTDNLRLFTNSYKWTLSLVPGGTSFVPVDLELQLPDYIGTPEKTTVLFACPEFCYLSDDVKNIVAESSGFKLKSVIKYIPNTINRYTNNATSSSEGKEFRIKAVDNGGFPENKNEIYDWHLSKTFRYLEPIKAFNIFNETLFPSGYLLGGHSRKVNEFTAEAELDYYITGEILGLNFKQINSTVVTPYDKGTIMAPEYQRYGRVIGDYFEPINNRYVTNLGSAQGGQIGGSGFMRLDLGLSSLLTTTYMNCFTPLFVQKTAANNAELGKTSVRKISYIDSPTHDQFAANGFFYNWLNNSTTIGSYKTFINWSCPLMNALKSAYLLLFEWVTNTADNNDYFRYLNGCIIDSEYAGYARYTMYPVGSGGKLMLLDLDMSENSGILDNVVTNPVYSAPTIHIANLLKPATPYGGYSEQAIRLSKFSSFGNYVPVEHEEDNTITANPIDVFDGDVYMTLFSYNALHDWHSYQYVQFTKMASVYVVPIESSMDLQAQWSQYSYGRVVSGQDGRFYDWRVQDTPALFLEYTQSQNSYLYNTAYNSLYGLTKWTTNQDDEKETSIYDTRVHYSDQKTNGETTDSWLTFRAINFLDVDSRYGVLTDLKTFKDRLIFWQDKAAGMLSVNEKTILKDSSSAAIVLGNGGVLDRYDYFTTVYGMKPHQFARDVSNNALYWWDGYTKEAILYSGEYSVVPLSTTKNIKNYININNESEIPSVIYDNKNKEVLFNVVNDEAVVYAELLQAFTSVYTFNPIWNAELNNGSVVVGDRIDVDANKGFLDGIYKYDECYSEYKIKPVAIYKYEDWKDTRTDFIKGNEYSVIDIINIFAEWAGSPEDPMFIKINNSEAFERTYSDWLDKDFAKTLYGLQNGEQITIQFMDNVTEPNDSIVLTFEKSTISYKEAYYFNKSKVLPKLEYVVNTSSETNKVFDTQLFGGRFYGGTTIDRKGEYDKTFLEPLNFVYKTPLKQQSSANGKDFITAVEYDYRLAVPRSEEFQPKYDWGNRMRGKTMQCTLSSESNNIDFSIQYIITKFRISWS